jgi:hypothetical protein
MSRRPGGRDSGAEDAEPRAGVVMTIVIPDELHARSIQLTHPDGHHYSDDGEFRCADGWGDRPS